MNHKFLIGFLLGCGLSVIQAAQSSSPVPFLQGIDPQIAAQLAGFADQVNRAQQELEDAIKRAVEAEKRAKTAEDSAGRIQKERDQLRSQQSTLLEDAAVLEKALKDAEQLAEQRRKLLDQAGKEKLRIQRELAELRDQSTKDQEQLATVTEGRAMLEKEQQRLLSEQVSTIQEMNELRASLSPVKTGRLGVITKVGIARTTQGVFDFGGIAAEIVAERAKTQEAENKLAQLTSRQTEIVGKLVRALAGLTAKDEEIARLRTQLEVTAQRTTELAQFKQAEEEDGCVYVTTDDAPSADTADLAQRLPSLQLLQDQSLKGRIFAVIRNLNRLVRS